MREGTLCGQGVTAGWGQTQPISGLSKDTTVILLPPTLDWKQMASQGGTLLATGEDDMTKAILFWGCSTHLQISYCLNCRELVMKLRVGLSGQVFSCSRVLSAFTGVEVPC